MKQISEVAKVVAGGLEQVKPVSTPSAPGVNQLEIALNGNAIARATNETIKKTFRVLWVKIGLRVESFPAEQDEVVIIKHLRNNYGNHTLEEIMLAFSLAMTDKIEADVNHFQDFSCAYVSRILNAYRAWAKKCYVYSNRVKPPKQNIDEKYIKEAFEEMSERVKAGTLAVENVLPFWYGELNLTNEQEYHKTAAIMIGKKLGKEKDATEYNRFKAMWTSGCFTYPYDKTIPELAKSISVYNYIIDSHD